MGGIDFIIQCASFLLGLDLLYTTIGALAVLIVCWLIRFIVTLKEDRDENYLHKRKNHRDR